MEHRTCLAALILALTVPAVGRADSPFDDCSEPGSGSTRSCLLEQMSEDPELATGPACTETVCRVELACEAGGAASRHCRGSGFDVVLSWNADRGDGFDMHVTEPDGSQSAYYICAGLGDATDECARPQRLEGSIEVLDLLTFPGGALLEYSPVRVIEPPSPVETYRVPAGLSAGAFNVRSGPGTVHEVLFSIPAGTGGIVLSGECRPPEPSGRGADWCPIVWQGQAGWISSRGLEIE